MDRMLSQPDAIANIGPSFIVGAKFARGLGIARIITGSMILLLALLTIPLLGWANYVGFMILSGLVVGFAGLLSLCSATKIESPGLHNANRIMGFTSALYMLIDFLICCVALDGMFHKNNSCYYGNNCYNTSNPTGLAIYSCLLALLVAEFAMALTVALSWYKYCSSRCCYGQEGEVEHQAQTTTSSALMQSSAHTSYQSCHPAVSSQHAFGSLAPPPYAIHQEDSSTNDDNAAPTQPTLMKFDPNVT